MLPHQHNIASGPDPRQTNMCQMVALVTHMNDPKIYMYKKNSEQLLYFS